MYSEALLHLYVTVHPAQHRILSGSRDGEVSRWGGGGSKDGVGGGVRGEGVPRGRGGGRGENGDAEKDAVACLHVKAMFVFDCLLFSSMNTTSTSSLPRMVIPHQPLVT